jgi:hypothetical protein
MTSIVNMDYDMLHFKHNPSPVCHRNYREKRAKLYCIRLHGVLH